MNFIDEKYFKIQDDNIIFTGPYMEAFIPSFYFLNGLAQELGESIKTFGLFSVITYNDTEGKKPNPIRTFNVPTEIITYPTKFETRKFDLVKKGEEEVFIVLKYYNNDIFCPAAVPKSLDTFKKFLTILTQGKIPGNTSYNDILNIWMANQELAGISFDISNTVYELVISEIYRDRKNNVNRFGSVLGADPKHSPYDYKTVSPRELTKINSTFTGITFENMNEMLIAGINRTNRGTAENISPMEEVMKY